MLYEHGLVRDLAITVATHSTLLDPPIQITALGQRIRPWLPPFLPKPPTVLIRTQRSTNKNPPTQLSSASRSLTLTDTIATIATSPFQYSTIDVQS